MIYEVNHIIDTRLQKKKICRTKGKLGAAWAHP